MNLEVSNFMPHLSLYRKYRPKKFEDLFGQSAVKKTICNAIKNSVVSHAYLFFGPRGVGKTTIARLLAKSINCQKRKEGEVESCGRCFACREISSGRAVDIIEIDAASNRGIDEIRSLKEKAKVSPLYLKNKVFIIDEAHMLTKEAFDALLKTLEEPAKRTFFILATTEFRKLPKTIVSRCQYFELSILSPDDLFSYLLTIKKGEKIKIDDDSLRYVAMLSKGYAREAVTMFEQVSSLGEINIPNIKNLFGIAPVERIFTFLEALSKKDIAAALKTINDISLEGKSILDFEESVISCTRLGLILKHSKTGERKRYGSLSEEEKERLIKVIRGLSDNDLILFIEKVSQLRKQFFDDLHLELPLELALIDVFGKKVKTPASQASESNLKSSGQELKTSALENKEEKPIVLEKSELLVLKDEKEIREQEKKSLSKEKKLSFKDVTKKWPDFISELKLYNYSLSGLLKSACLLEIKNDKLIIVCEFAFHTERIRDLKNRTLLEDVFLKVYGDRLILECVNKDDLLKEDLDKFCRIKEKKEHREKEIVKETFENAVEVFGNGANE